MIDNKICKSCKRCHKKFFYGDMNRSLKGQMTRRYCDVCRVLQHRDEAKLYRGRYING